jgi:hypothetical protein
MYVSLVSKDHSDDISVCDDSRASGIRAGLSSFKSSSSLRSKGSRHRVNRSILGGYPWRIEHFIGMGLDTCRFTFTEEVAFNTSGACVSGTMC